MNFVTYNIITGLLWDLYLDLALSPLKASLTILNLCFYSNSFSSSFSASFFIFVLHFWKWVEFREICLFGTFVFYFFVGLFLLVLKFFIACRVIQYCVTFESLCYLCFTVIQICCSKPLICLLSCVSNRKTYFYIYPIIILQYYLISTKLFPLIFFFNLLMNKVPITNVMSWPSHQAVSGGYMVAFAGRKYAARSLPVFVADNTNTITSFTLVFSSIFYPSIR